MSNPDSLRQACVVCANTEGHRLHYPREMMFGTGEVFEYLECGHCGCTQIVEVPADLGRFYPGDEYYSYQAPRTKTYPAWMLALRTLRTQQFLGRKNLFGALLAALSKESEHFAWFRKGRVSLESRILEIGCGSGKLLLKLQREGFANLLGMDPFIANDLDYGNGVRVLKRTVDQLEGCFDFVMLHHAFEHMPDPKSSLAALHGLVATQGTLLLRIPVADCHARRKYGIFWSGWDAPRHLYLHTVRSMHLLADAGGFKIVDVTYDSSIAQFVGSESYLRGIANPSKSRHGLSATEWRALACRSKQLNDTRDGDTACFFLRRK